MGGVAGCSGVVDVSPVFAFALARLLFRCLLVLLLLVWGAVFALAFWLAGSCARTIKSELTIEPTTTNTIKGSVRRNTLFMDNPPVFLILKTQNSFFGGLTNKAEEGMRNFGPAKAKKRTQQSVKTSTKCGW
jgi:hypothetical protein